MGRRKDYKETIINLEMDTAPLELDAKDATLVLNGLEKAVKGLKLQIEDTFKDTSIPTMSVDMDRLGKKMSDALLVMRFNLGKLRVALTEAASPLGAVFLPMVNQATASVTRLVRSVGLVLGALLGTDALGESARSAADAEKELESAATAAGKAAKRSLAGFDQINRLAAPTGGASAGAGKAPATPESTPDTLRPQLQAIVDKITALLAPLRAMDFAPLKEALAGLGQAFSSLGSIAGGALEWLWFAVLTPFMTWVVQALAPTLTELLTGALALVSAAVQPVISGFQVLWQALQPIVAFIGESVILALQGWKEAMDGLALVFEEKGPAIEGIFRNVGQVISAVWSVVQPVLAQMRTQFGITFGEIGTVAGQILGNMICSLQGVTEFLAGVFTGDWQRAWGGLSQFLKTVVNNVIGVLNLMLSGIAGALNSVIRLANSLSFTVPDWVPGIGGDRFGFNLKTVATPRIPYLAKGAVLPANKPFLAMVGDQKHGTNIEAPLATIQEAVAVVMEDMQRSNLSGQQAIVGVLGEILEAVLGIRIGDQAIAQAVERYNRRQQIMRGGTL